MLLRRGGAGLQWAAMRATSSTVKKRGKVVVITGPTGVGKSSVAISLAKRLGGEIISADSVQVYKGLDIGSAKTPVNDRQNVPHHLIDIVQPTDDYSVGDFFKDARAATDMVLAKGRVPIVVGGTGLYLLWYMNGRPNTPKATEEQAAAVDEELQSIGGGWEAALKYLADAGDPETAQSLARNDWYRLRRALEILKISGQPRNSFPLPWSTLKEGLTPDKTHLLSEAANISQTSEPQQLDYDFHCYFMYMKRAELYRRLDLRCEEMLTDTQGLLQEASWLLDLGILPNSSSPSRAIGYRQTMEYLSACRLARGVTSPKEFLAFLSGFQKASRNYAKRQLTWFRGEDDLKWINASLPMENIVDCMEEEFKKSSTVAGPSSWEIEQRSAMVKEVKALKTYVTENRIFVDVDACSCILEWIEKTQKVHKGISNEDR